MNIKDTYKKIIKPTIILSLILLVVSTALALTYKLTRQEVDKNSELQQTLVLAKEVLPDADEFDVVGEVLIAKNGVGKVVKQASKGYNEDIVLMIGYDNDFVIKGIKVISQAETPGLGTEVESPSFLNQFIDKSAPFSVKKSPDETKIDALSGATISSKAVCDAVNKILGEGK
jgi:electron transport complex protein RnfG